MNKLKNCSDLSLFEYCSSDLKIFANSWPSVLNFKIFSRSLVQFYLKVGQNNFGDKMSFQNVHLMGYFIKSTALQSNL